MTMMTPFNIEEFQTDNYKLSIGLSEMKEYSGNIYKVINKHTDVCEHECPYFAESVGFLMALEEKLHQAIEAFMLEKAEKKVKVPDGTMH